MLPTKTCNFNWIGEQHYHCILAFLYVKILMLLESTDRLLWVSKTLSMLSNLKCSLADFEIEIKFMYYKHQIYEVF